MVFRYSNGPADNETRAKRDKDTELLSRRCETLITRRCVVYVYISRGACEVAGAGDKGRARSLLPAPRKEDDDTGAAQGVSRSILECR